MTTTNQIASSFDVLVGMIAKLEIEDKVKLWQLLDQEITQSQKPWLKTAGIFKEDPHFADVQRYINEYRQKIDEIEE